MTNLTTSIRALLASLCVFPTSLIVGCSNSQPPVASNDSPRSRGELGAFEGSSRDGIERLATRLIGTYRASLTTGNTLLPERIHLNINPIWPSRTESERWLYVEQASEHSKNKPDRQLIYRVFCAGKEGWANVDGDKPWCARFPDILIDTSRYLYCIEVFTLPDNANAYAGGWQSRSTLDMINALDPASLSPKRGCEIYLVERLPGVFIGGTRANSCAFDTPHTTYVTCEIDTSSDITIWERGYSDSGVQVWGPIDGGYRFEDVDPDHIMY